MQITDPILAQQLPAIRKIIQDETWLEGERRGCQVAPSDRVVRDRVCEIVLRVGQQLRDSVTVTGGTADRVGMIQLSRDVTATVNPPNENEAA
jgi:hypothetical protein